MAMQSRAPKSIRYSAAEWAPFEEAALVRDLEPSTLARECSFIGLNVLSSPAVMEAYCRALSALRRSLRASDATNDSLKKEGARR